MAALQSQPKIETNTLQDTVFTAEMNGKAFKILVNGLYSDKIQSIVRELMSNAYDSHIEKGNADEAFKIVLPTALFPEFSIRDYGVSLTHDLVMGLYTTLFKSTKDKLVDPDSGEVKKTNGKLGLGAKVPFSYTDNFTVTAFLNGECRFYSAMIDENGTPRMFLMGSEPTEERDGLQVSFPVEQADYAKFKQSVIRASVGFDVKPICTQIREDEHITYEKMFEGDGWYIIRNSAQGRYTQWNSMTDIFRTPMAKMGTVFYPIDTSASPKFNGFKEFMSPGVVIEFEPDELEISASRESLSYGRYEPTVDNIVAKIRTIELGVLKKMQEEIDAQPSWLAATAVYYKFKNEMAFLRDLWARITSTNLLTYNGEPFALSVLNRFSGLPNEVWMQKSHIDYGNLSPSQVKMQKQHGSYLDKFQATSNDYDLKKNKPLIGLYLEESETFADKRNTNAKILAHAKANRYEYVFRIMIKDVKNPFIQANLPGWLELLDGVPQYLVADIPELPKPAPAPKDVSVEPRKECFNQLRFRKSDEFVTFNENSTLNRHDVWMFYDKFFEANPAGVLVPTTRGRYKGRPKSLSQNQIIKMYNHFTNSQVEDIPIYSCDQSYMSQYKGHTGWVNFEDIFDAYNKALWPTGGNFTKIADMRDDINIISTYDKFLTRMGYNANLEHRFVLECALLAGIDIPGISKEMVEKISNWIFEKEISSIHSGMSQVIMTTNYNAYAYKGEQWNPYSSRYTTSSRSKIARECDTFNKSSILKFYVDRCQRTSKKRTYANQPSEWLANFIATEIDPITMLAISGCVEQVLYGVSNRYGGANALEQSILFNWDRLTESRKATIMIVINHLKKRKSND